MTAVDDVLAAMRANVFTFRAAMARAGFFLAGHLPGWDVDRRMCAARAAINNTTTGTESP
jgi:hypothetical protein